MLVSNIQAVGAKVTPLWGNQPLGGVGKETMASAPAAAWVPAQAAWRTGRDLEHLKAVGAGVAIHLSAAAAGSIAPGKAEGRIYACFLHRSACDKLSLVCKDRQFTSRQKAPEWGGNALRRRSVRPVDHSAQSVFL
jgi:hypothetical protein